MPSAMAPLIGELSAKLTERVIGCSLGLRCGVPPRQTHEMNAGRRWPSAMAPLIGELSAKLTERLISWQIVPL